MPQLLPQPAEGMSRLLISGRRSCWMHLLMLNLLQGLLMPSLAHRACRDQAL